jgi:hypothetical protein
MKTTIPRTAAAAQVHPYTDGGAPASNTTTQRRTRKAEKDDTVRFNLYLPKDVYDGLESLRQMTGKSSIAETVRSAVKLYQFIQENLHDGKELFLEDREENVRDRLIPS